MAADLPHLPTASPAAPAPRQALTLPLILLVAGALTLAAGGTLLMLARQGGLGEPVPDVLRVAISVVVFTGLALATAGLGSFVFGPVAAGPEAAAAGFGSHRVMLTTTAFAILLAALIGSVLPLLVQALTGERGLRNLPGFLAAALSVNLALLGVAYLRFIRPGVVALDSFGFGDNRLAPRFFNQVWLADLITGVGGGLLVMLLSGTVQAALRQLGVQQTQLLDFTWIRQLPPAHFGLIWVAGAVVAPLAEELFFRGLIFRGYLETRGPLVAYLLSAFVFSMLHLNLPAFPPIFVLGLVLAWLYRKTGSLTPAVVAHGFNNGVAFLVLRYVENLPGTVGG